MHVNTINEVLSRVPGIYSSRLKGIANSSPTILMRGLNNQAQNLVLVDGQPLNDASSAVVGWSDIPVDSVARIEVVKGTASALYGSQAMGGVVNIITKIRLKVNARCLWGMEVMLLGLRELVLVIK